ncbi:uncharacterized protein TM35_000162080 [Trypanosoma theileri]|uniref:Leucine-rich repeat protein (LRRP) n=1 Tax=Trypanosoma theileri TaxID=67003 RepID=A0A1X0NWU7_9TRYP|nr:uncharacterized protein TM35_000162080 [Trypanosoma theileri]ORC88570.1 hypothetical protein TM35_000162080 [Trypanosoma theileri]
MQINLSRRNLIEFDSSAFTTDDDQEVLRSIKELNISFNNISTLKGLHRLSTLTTVDVSHNSIASLRGLPLPLRKLNASFNVLSDLDGLFPLLHLEILVVSHNQITSLRGLPAKLRIIDASSNRITSIVGVEKCNGLEQLQISQNMIRTAEGLESLKSLHTLKSLMIAENPVTRSRRHITAVSSLLPDNLEIVDLPSFPRTMQSSEVSSQSNNTHDVSSNAISLNTTSFKDAINLSVLSSTSTGKVSHETSIYGCQSQVPSYLHHIPPKGIRQNEEETENLINKKVVSFGSAEKSIERPHSSVPSVTVPIHSSVGTSITVNTSQDTSITQQHPQIERVEKRQEEKIITEVDICFSEIPTKHVTESMVERLQFELDECRRVCAFYKKENAELRHRIQYLELVNKQQSKSKEESLEGNLFLQLPSASGSSPMKISALPDALNGERNMNHSNFSVNPVKEEVRKPLNESGLNCEEKILPNNHHRLHQELQELPGEVLSLDEKVELRRGARSLAALFMSLVPVSTNSLSPSGTISAGDAHTSNDHQHQSPSCASGMDYNHNSGGPCSSERQRENQQQNVEAGRRKRTVSFGGFAYYSPPQW